MHVPFLIPPKCAKTREPEDEHCVLQYTHTCNTLPLDKCKTYSHPALPYITWGLIWDSKIRREESLDLKFCTRQVSGILKLRQKEEIPIEKNFFCKLLVSQLIKYKQQKKVFRLEIQQVGKGLQFSGKDNTATSSKESSNSSIWDELKFVRLT